MLQELQDEIVKALLVLITTGVPLLVAWMRSKHQRVMVHTAVAHFEEQSKSSKFPNTDDEELVILSTERVKHSMHPLATTSHNRLKTMVEKEVKSVRGGELARTMTGKKL